MKIFNFVFTGVFVFEAAMKAYALGIRRYLKDKWNQLDVAIVLLSILGIILEEMESVVIPINPTIIRVMRVMRIARVLKLLKMAKGIRQLLDTVMQALPQVGNLGLLFFLLFFIFAALGTELFGRLGKFIQIFLTNLLFIYLFNLIKNVMKIIHVKDSVNMHIFKTLEWRF